MDEYDDDGDGQSLEPECTGMKRPPLIQELSKILDEYPDDGQILKELIQNAEDASAMEMKVFYDTRQTSPQYLWFGGQRKTKYSKYFEGPALFVCNDEYFSEKDWDGIKQIGQSIKELDPSKVGRFGLGFKSVFHITDYPLIISGKQMLIIDPHRDEARCCLTFDLRNLHRYTGFNTEECRAALDGVFGFSGRTIQEGHYDGTLFRFPLRQKGTDLSSTIYSQAKIEHLLEVFEKEASVSLIFLKSLVKLSLFRSLENLSKNVPDFSVNVGGQNAAEARRARSEMKSVSLPAQSVERCFRLDIETARQGVCKGRQTWLVVSRLEGIAEGSQRLTSLAKSLSYLPYVGVAAPLHNLDSFMGHVFCFLPLPMPAHSITNLPVHINGQFALSQNRQHLKWADIYAASFKEKSVQWNECLLEEVLPKAYTSLIKVLCNCHGDPDRCFTMVTGCLPDLQSTVDHFKPCVRQLFESLEQIRCVYTKNDQGKWILWEDAVFLEAPIDQNVEAAVRDCLEEYGVNLVDTQGYKRMFHILRQADRNPQSTSPEYISRLLRSDPRYRHFSADRKDHILQFLLHGCQTHLYRSLLQGLELLPLADGSYTTFKNSAAKEVYFCTSELQQLLPRMGDRFLRLHTSLTVQNSLRDLSRSGHCQLRDASCAKVICLLSDCIQRNNEPPQKQKSGITWIHGAALDEKWLRSVWQYLKRGTEQLPKNLHIIPQTESTSPLRGYLCTLDQPLIVAEDHRNKLPAGVVRCLQALSITVLSKLPVFVAGHPAVYQDCVERPCVEGVLKMLLNVDTGDIENFNRSRSVSMADRETFVQYLGSSNIYGKAMNFIQSWVFGTQQSKEETLEKAYTVLRQLDIFHSKKRGEGRFLAADKAKGIAPSDDLPVHLPGAYIYCRSQEERNLAKAVKLDELNVEDAVGDILYHLSSDTFYSEPEKGNMMTYFTKNFSLFQRNRELTGMARRTNFVANGRNQFKKPNELYNPHDKLVNQLFRDDRKFPRIQNKEYIDVLKSLGLKTSADVTPKELFEVANIVHSKSSEGFSSGDITSQADALVKVLCRNTELLSQVHSGQSLCDRLAQMQIIRPLERQTYPKPLTWYSSSTLLCEPKQCATKEYMSLVGSIMPIFPDGCSRNFTDAFHQQPSIENVIKQLYHLSERYCEAYKPELLVFMKEIYTFLNDSDLEISHINDMKGSNSVWTGYLFCPPALICLEKSIKDIKLEPYLYNLPPEFRAMENLFSNLECVQRQCPEILYNIQKKIKDYHSRSRTEAECRRDLEIIINILNLFKEDDSARNYDLFFPIHISTKTRLYLRPASECNYCNEDWLKDFATDDDNEVCYVHQDIPVSTAAALGVKSLTESLCEDAGLLEWEQEVSVVNRIKSLLRGYRDGLSVPKELIQNADDAGASKVCFLYDERENLDCKTRLLNERMSDCQGPALWAYNDAKFSEEDITNITKVEGGTKENDLSKTGKFGVGFCSVFNLTDVPSFISGHRMVIFDPQGAYLTNKKKKGMKLDFRLLKNRSLLRRMNNQFKPFIGVFYCNLNAEENRIPNYEGTLFRFPLRTAKQRQSELSSIVYTHAEMRKLLNILIESAGNLLLFTQNVCEIELYHLPGNESDPKRKKLIFKVSRNIRRPLQNSLTTGWDTLIDNQKLMISKTCAEKLKRLKVGSEEILEDLSLGYLTKIVLKFEGNGKQFHGQTERQEETLWLISWATGTKDCLKLSVSSTLNSAMPLAATAVLVECKEGQHVTVRLSKAPYGFYKTSHIFCTLPLPVESPFQFHINGAFAVTQDRKQLSNETIEDKKRLESSWNHAVMTDSVVTCIMNLLETLKQHDISPGEAVHTIWPVSEFVSQSDLFKHTQEVFLQELIKSHRPVIFQKDFSNWIPFSSCRFLEPRLLDSHIGELAGKLSTSLYAEKGLYVIKIPIWLLHLMKTVDEETVSRNTISTEDFYRDVYFPLLEASKMEDAERDKLLLFAVDANAVELDNMLKNHSCFPASDGTLKKPSELILETSLLKRLYLPEEGKFLADREGFRKWERLTSFRRLGMLYDCLSDEWLIARLMSVERLLDVCSYCAVQRCRDLLQYLSRLNSVSESVLACARKLKFLPVTTKPKDWLFKWQADDVVSNSVTCTSDHLIRHTDIKHLPNRFAMAAPENLYFEECKDLVGCTELLLHARSIRCSDRDKVLRWLGIKGNSADNVPLEVVLKQLDVLTENKGNLSTGKSLVLDRTLRTVFMHLEKTLKGSDRMVEDDLKQKLDQLHDKPILFINEKFWRPSQTCYELRNSSNCYPLLIGIHQSDSYLKHCRSVLDSLGVKSRFSSGNIVKAIRDLQSSINLNDEINDSVLNLICGLLEALYDALKMEGALAGSFHPFMNGDILLPDTHGYLCHVQDLCVDDNKRLRTTASMRFIHGKVPIAHAVLFGVKTKMKRKVKDHRRRLPFGQREELTKRIHRILEGYPADEGIFKELLQNADDAGASEISFIKDPNNYPHDSVFEGTCSWGDLQGPALLVYNNSSFNEDDLNGIQHLGVGSKADDPTKTGQYGVGFNAVYHLTDVPSFITKGPDLDEGGSTLCILDPHCKYAEDADMFEPGARYCYLEELKECKPDVFKPYHESELIKDVGTIFRFPLRTEPMAEQSCLWKEEIRMDKLDHLLESFKSDAFHCLLFLKHVRKITFAKVVGDEIVEEYVVTQNMSEEDSLKRYEFHEKRKDLGKIIKESSDCGVPHEFLSKVQTFTPLEISTKVSITDSGSVGEREKSKRIEDWVVIEKIGFGDKQPPEVVLEGYREGNLCLLPQGGVAFPIRQGGVACQDNKFRAFCFLPLPTETGLPMHVNGHFALNHESRRNLWEDNKESLKMVWNHFLMSAVIAPAYISAIEYHKVKCKSSIHGPITEGCLKRLLGHYWTVFPSFDTSSDMNWKYLCKEIYLQLGMGKEVYPCTTSQEMKLIEETLIRVCNVDWICLRGRITNFPSIFCLNENDSLSPTSVPNIMKTLKMNVIDFSNKVYEEMEKFSIDVKCVTADVVISFLKTYTNSTDDSCRIDCFGQEIKQTSFKSVENVREVLSFCKQSTMFQREIVGLPLCVLNDGTLKEFTEEQPIFCTCHCDVMRNLEDQFLHRHLCSVLNEMNSSCIKPFKVNDFSQLLAFVMPTEIYRNTPGDIRLSREKEAFPNARWLCQVWEFLADTIKQDKKEKETVNDFLVPLAKWKLIPTLKMGELYLQPLSQAKNILNVQSFFCNNHLYDVISKLQIPFLCRRIFHTGLLLTDSPADKLLVECVSSHSNPVEVLSCFQYHLKDSRVELSGEKCATLLEYFNDHLKKLRSTYVDVVNHLRCLPFYETIDGRNTCLQNRQITILVLPSTIPFDGIKELAQNSRVVLLKENVRIKDLHSFLGFTSSSLLDVYTRYIIPNFASLPETSYIAHLQFIRDELLRCNLQSSFDHEQEQLIGALRNCNFLLVSGRSYYPREFFSPYNKVFKVMLTEDKFPPKPYDDYKWAKFMEVAGMNASVTPALLMQFVKEIEREGLVALQESTEKKSEVLLKHISTERDNLSQELRTPPLCDLKTTRFIVPLKLWESHPLLDLYPQYQGRPLISFEESTRNVFLQLVWTTCSMLPYYTDALTTDLTIRSLLGIEEKPLTADVVKNMQLLSDSVQEKLVKSADFKSRLRSTNIKKVFQTHYEYLQRNCLSDNTLKNLIEKPVVFLETENMCVLCRQIVYGLPSAKEVKPYLFTAPLEYGSFADLFERLGASTEATAILYVNVLRSLYLDTLDQNGKPDKLHPNEMNKILDPTLYYLFTSPRLTCQTSTKVYLPDRDFRLQISSDLIASDNEDYEHRLSDFNWKPFFLGFAKLRLSEEFTNESDILCRLPKHLRPSFLTDIVEEKITNVQTCMRNSNVTKLSQFLKCDEFLEGILRLVVDDKGRNRYENDIYYPGSSLTTEQESKIIGGMSRIHIALVSVLQTELVVDNKTIAGSKVDKKTLIHRETANAKTSWTLYCIENGMPLQEWLEDVLDDLTTILFEITSQELQSNQKHIYRLLGCIDNPGAIEGLLNKLHVKQLRLSQRSSEMFPDPGTFVPKSFHHLLDNSFCEFEVDDYVALLIYEEETENGIPTADPVYIYAIVIECSGQPDSVCDILDIARMKAIYLLKVGVDTFDYYPAWKIFKFHRRRNETSTAIQPVVNVSYPRSSQPLDFILLDVQRQFLAIMALGNEAERRNLVRRLRARWHPDQNYGNEDQATRVFQYIEELIRIIRNGEQIDGQPSGANSYRAEDIPHSYRPTATPPTPQRFSSHTSRTHGERREKLSIPQLARKWFQQAEYDIRAANAFEPCSESVEGFNWICYLCHQSIEKSMKALWYYTDANYLTQMFHSHDVCSIARGLPISDLTGIAHDIDSIVGHHTRMRYPDQQGVRLPAHTFDEDMAKKCVELAHQTIELVGDYMRH